jgi:hypothetical protein
MTSQKLDEAAIFNAARRLDGPDAQRLFIVQVYRSAKPNSALTPEKHSSA